MRLSSSSMIQNSHTGVRLENIFDDDKAITLVDCQLVCRSAPEQDFAYFITQSVSQDIRHQKALLKVDHE
jgi:hypothetical protein